MNTKQRTFAQKTAGNPNEAGLRLFTTPREIGPQYVANELEADLVTQLAVSMNVDEIITHPLIHDLQGIETFCPDLFVRTKLDRDALSSVTYAIYVSNGNEKDKEIEASAGAWCAATDTRLRIVGVAEIRTPFLANARLMERYANAFPDGEQAAMGALWAAVEGGPVTVVQATREIAALFESIDDATLFVEACVAKQIVACDLSQPFGPQSMISAITAEYAETNRNDPILRLIEDADDGRSVPFKTR